MAVCVPNQPKVEEWAKNNGLMGDFARICRDPKTHAHIMAALNATGKAKKVTDNKHKSMYEFTRSMKTWNIFLSTG